MNKFTFILPATVAVEIPADSEAEAEGLVRALAARLGQACSVDLDELEPGQGLLIGFQGEPIALDADLDELPPTDVDYNSIPF